MRALALSLLVLLTGCLSPTRSSQPVHTIAIDREDFSDLAFLKPLLDGKRVVQLGENTHGAREYNQVKARLVRYLHQELGYTVLAFESDVYQCHVANETLATAPPRSTLFNCAFGVWHTEPVLDMFDYLQQTHATDQPMQLAGFDVQPIGPNKAGRPAFLAKAVRPLNADYAVEVQALDSTFLAVYSEGSRARRQFFRSEAGTEMLAAYDQLVEVLSEAASSAPELGIARQTAYAQAQYIRIQTAPTTRAYVEFRDKGMADNMAYLLDEAYPEEKVIVWGHNFHLRHNNLRIPPDSTMFPTETAHTMGYWLHERYGDAVYTIGLYAHQGKALNNAGEPFPLTPADAGLEARTIDAFGPGAHFIDLAHPNQPGWLRTPISAAFNGTTPLTMTLAEQYDAVLVLDTVTPRTTLY
ncbi:MAG: erythromycin esterase family protein [Rhodothermales bacterium]